MPASPDDIYDWFNHGRYQLQAYKRTRWWLSKNYAGLSDLEREEVADLVFNNAHKYWGKRIRQSNQKPLPEGLEYLWRETNAVINNQRGWRAADKWREIKKEREADLQFVSLSSAENGKEADLLSTEIEAEIEEDRLADFERMKTQLEEFQEKKPKNKLCVRMICHKTQLELDGETNTYDKTANTFDTTYKNVKNCIERFGRFLCKKKESLEKGTGPSHDT
jgi:hypothetical protein